MNDATDETLEPAIDARAVSRAYGDVHAVRHLSFHVARGEVVGLLGPNGAGKTTMLRMIATLIPPDSGAISVDGFDTVVDAARVRSRLGYQTGDTGLYQRLTPREFLTYFGRLNSIDPETLKHRVESLVADFGIGEYADRLCGNLSTGQRQRVSIARTLIADPPVLVLDEPTSGLDVLSSTFILDSMRAFAAQGRAVLFSTHVMSEVELVCDRIIVMHRGEKRAEGTVEQLTQATGRAHLSQAFLDLVRDPTPLEVAT